MKQNTVNTRKSKKYPPAFASLIRKTSWDMEKTIPFIERQLRLRSQMIKEQKRRAPEDRESPNATNGAMSSDEAL